MEQDGRLERNLVRALKDRGVGHADLEQLVLPGGGGQPERVVVLGRQPLGARADPVVPERDLLGLLRRDTRNGNHATIVCARRSSPVNRYWRRCSWLSRPVRARLG